MRLTMVIVSLLLAFSGPARAADARSAADLWDLDALYDNPERWNGGLSALVEAAGLLADCARDPDPGPERLADCLGRRFDEAALARRTLTWAELQVLSSGEGQNRVANWNRAMAPFDGLFQRFDAAVARLDPARIPAAYRAWHAELRRNLDHLPTPAQQPAWLAIRATARPFDEVYRAISEEPLAWPGVALSDGRVVAVDPVSYPHLLWRADADDRFRSSQLYWAAWDISLHALAVNLNGRFQADARLARALAFDSVLDRELFRAALPGDTLSRVRYWTNQGRDMLGAWFRLRGRVLQTGDIGIEDLHVPLAPVPSFALDEARDILIEALGPLHGRAASVIREGFDGGWLQELPAAPGFVASAGAGTHPYIGVDYRGDVLSLLELARLWGIALHRHFSEAGQPLSVSQTWPLIDDTIATVAELMVLDYLGRGAASEEEQLAWLSVAQDFWYRRFFRPGALADFERTLRDWAAAGDPFPVGRLNTVFGQNLSRVHPAGVSDDLAFRSGWAAEAALYDPYAGLRQVLATAAAAQLADGLVRKGGTAPAAFRRLLGAGRSAPAAVLLQAAGVDFSADTAFEQVAKASQANLDRLGELLPAFAPDADARQREEVLGRLREDPLEGGSDAETPGD